MTGRSSLALLLLLACSGDGTDTTPAAVDTAIDTAAGGDASDGDTAESSALPQPVLPRIPEAEDLDDADGSVVIALTAAESTHEITDWRTGETLIIDGYAYNNQVPGPTIRASVGDTVSVTLTNALDTPTTIHWHGLDVPWDMDGVTWKQDPIDPGESFTYSFTVNQTGTYWYHPHYDTHSQVDLGLYGAFIVDDSDTFSFDDDVVVFVDDWQELDYDAASDTGTRHEEGVATSHGAHGNEGLWTANGAVTPTLSAQAGDAVRLRLINASNTGYMDLDPDGGRWIGSDQGRMASPTDGRLLLAPGDRAELEWHPGADGGALVDHPYSHKGGEALGSPEDRLQLDVAGSADASDPLDLDFSGQAPSDDPGTTDVLWTFQGSLHTDAWMINGEQYPEVTVPEVTTAAPVVIEVRNVSPTEHPFHLHGHSFEVLSIDGVVPEYKTVEDTVNIGMYGTARLLLDPDNIGEWMAHCHILPHGHGGMMTVLSVVSPPE